MDSRMFADMLVAPTRSPARESREESGSLRETNAEYAEMYTEPPYRSDADGGL